MNWCDSNYNKRGLTNNSLADLIVLIFLWYTYKYHKFSTPANFEDELMNVTSFL